MVGGGGLKRENEVAGSSPWGCGDCVRALFVGICNRTTYKEVCFLPLKWDDVFEGK